MEASRSSSLLLLQSLPLRKAGRIGLEDKTDLIPHTAKFIQNLILGSRGMSRVVEAPVETVHLSREHRACLVCIPAHGDHGIDGAIQKLIHVLGVVSALERDGSAGKGVRQLFRIADEAAFKRKPINPETLWPLQPELESLIAELRRKLR